MKVLLIDPPWVIENKENLWSKLGSCLPSLGLAYIAAVVEKAGHDVKILDCTAERVSVDMVRERLRRFDSFDYVGLTATTTLIVNALKIAAIVKDLFPNTKIVFGGVHSSVMPDEVLSDSNIDFVIRDEGEITFKELIEGKDISEISGLSYKDKEGNIYHNPERPLIKNLDEIPPPAYHLLPMDKYYPAVGNYKRLPAMSIFATRGCPGRCTFCHRSFRGVVRPRSARNIVDEINILQKNYGIKEINFYDDTFTLFKRVVKEFCEIVLNENIDITWSCFTRVDYVDYDTLKIMKEAGCHLILFGVESADEEILKTIKKNISLEQVKKVVRMSRKIGIETRASFMLGNPGETVETMEKTIKFAIELDPDEVQFNITTVYPGTEMYEWAKEKGYLIAPDWSKHNLSDVVMNLPTVTPDQLQEYYAKAHKEFYLRPKIIFRRFFKIRSIIQLKQEFTGALAVLGFGEEMKT